MNYQLMELAFMELIEKKPKFNDNYKHYVHIMYVN